MTTTEKTASSKSAEGPVLKEGTEIVDKGFIRVQTLDPNRQLPGTSRYLDDEQIRLAEIDRARVEDRKPDFENPGTTQGTPYIQEAALKAQLPPSANVDAEVLTLPVVVSKD